MQKYKLIASDCDGTLIGDSDGFKMSDRTKRAIHSCMDRGVIFVLATGRPTYGIQWYADLFEQDMPLVTFNGSVTSMSKSGKVLFEQTMSYELCLEVLEWGQRRDGGMVTYVNNELYVLSNTAWAEDYALFYNRPYHVSDNPIETVKNGVSKILIIDDPDKIESYYSETQEHFRGRLNCFTSAPFLFEFLPPDTSKGDALRQLGQHYGIKPEEMVAVGDEFNDESMIRFAGLGVAMENAPQALKDAADMVTLSNNEDGVAVLIEQLIAEHQI